MSDGCQKAYEEWDRKREARKQAEQDEETHRRNMKNLAVALGLSVATIVAVAVALAAVAASGVDLPAAIGIAIVIIGYAAIFTGAAALGALISAIPFNPVPRTKLRHT